MERALAVLRESGIFPGEAFVPQSDEQDAPQLEVSHASRGAAVSANAGVKFKRTGPNLQKRRRVSRLGLYDGESRRDSRGRIT